VPPASHVPVRPARRPARPGASRGCDCAGPDILLTNATKVPRWSAGHAWHGAGRSAESVQCGDAGEQRARMRSAPAHGPQRRMGAANRAGAAPAAPAPFRRWRMRVGRAQGPAADRVRRAGRHGRAAVLRAGPVRRAGVRVRAWADPVRCAVRALHRRPGEEAEGGAAFKQGSQPYPACLPLCASAAAKAKAPQCMHGLSPSVAARRHTVELGSKPCAHHPCASAMCAAGCACELGPVRRAAAHIHTI